MIAALFDHLWQSTLFALGAGLLTLTLRENGAHVRYWLWFAASVKFLVPFSLLEQLGGFLLPPGDAPSLASPVPIFAEQMARPFSGASPVVSVPAAGGPSIATILALLWAIGFVAVLMLWLVRWMQVHAARRSATSLAITAPMPVKASHSSLEPGLVGIWRPELLLPEGFVTQLTAEETHVILAHEICHLKRRDNLTAAIHMIVEVLFWFFPLVWWIGARLIDERERACDEAVVASGNDAETYAESVLKVCRFYLHAPLACTAGVSGADLKKRMEAIMEGRLILRLSGLKKLLLAAAAAAALVVPLALGVLHTPAAIAQPSPSEQTAFAQRLAEQNMPRTAVAIDPRSFDQFSGYYQFSPSAYLHVFRDGDHFFCQLTGQPAVEFFPENQTKFFAKVVAAQLSFDKGAGGPEVVLHQAGQEQHALKVAESVATGAAAALQQRIASKTPSPGSEASLRRYIESLEKGAPNYEEMSPQLAAAVRQQLPVILDLVHHKGAFKSLAFAGVAPNGWDVYVATFEHGQLKWYTAPLTPDGKVAGRGATEMMP